MFKDPQAAQQYAYIVGCHVKVGRTGVMDGSTVVRA